MAAYLDLLEANAFGNYRTLLQQISLSAAMGDVPHLPRQPQGQPGHRRAARRELRARADAAVHHRPVQAQPRRQRPAGDGVPVETYTQDDITGLARVFTGWDFDLAGSATPRDARLPAPADDADCRAATRPAPRPSSAPPSRPAPMADGGADDARSTRIFAHPNVAPFISQAADPAPGHQQPEPGLCRPRSRPSSTTTAAACAAT